MTRALRCGLDKGALPAALVAAGTYQGMIERLDYLSSLGVNAVELLPVHVSLVTCTAVIVSLSQCSTPSLELQTLSPPWIFKKLL